MSAAPVVLGSTAATKQPDQTNWGTDGESTSRTYIGPQSAIETLFATEKATPTLNWVSMSLQRGPVSTLTLNAEATSSSFVGGVIDNFWELDRNTYRKPLRTHPFFDPEQEDPYLNRIDFLLSKGTEPDWVNDTLLAGRAESTRTYFFHRKNGVQAYQESSFVLRNTRTTNSTATVQNAYTDVGRVAALPGDVSSFLIGALPISQTIPVNGVPTTTPLEWLKQPPDVNRINRKKWEMVQEYWSGTPNWSVIYGGSWNPNPFA